jgi:hypothetical protein
MEFLIIVVSLVVFVLSIILFFKVWGMTNNVKKIKGVICENELSHNEIGMLVINDVCTDDEVSRILSTNFLRESMALYIEWCSDRIWGEDYALKYSEIVSFYNKMYKLRPNIVKTDWLCVSFNEFKKKYKETLS